MNRRIKRVAVVTGALLGLAGMAMAAVFFMSAHISGSVTSGSMDYQWTGGPSFSWPQGQQSAFWNGGSVSDSELTLQKGKAYLPGDKVVVGATLKVNGNTDGQVVGVDLGTMPNGVKASLEPGMCGMKLPIGQAKQVAFSVEALPTIALDGATYTLPSTAGIKVAPFDPAFAGTC